MLYEKHYNILIARARDNPPIGYCEIHHIVPRCIGGSNEQTNLIALTARQHFVAHLLLAKIYGGKLIIAAFLMSKDRKYSSRHYEWLRRAYCKNLEGNSYGKYGKGLKRSDETRARISAAQKGRPSPIKGKKVGKRKKRQSAESRAHKSKVMKALWEKRRAEGFHQKSHKVPRSQDYCKRLSDARKGHEVSESTRAKISQSVRNSIERRKSLAST